MQFILLGYQFVTIATETDKHLDYNLVRLEKKINFDLFPYPQALPSCPVLSSGSCPYHSLPFCHFPVIHSQVARENCFFMGLSHRNQEKTYTVISAYLRSFQLVQLKHISKRILQSAKSKGSDLDETRANAGMAVRVPAPAVCPSHLHKVPTQG